MKARQILILVAVPDLKLKKSEIKNIEHHLVLVAQLQEYFGGRWSIDKEGEMKKIDASNYYDYVDDVLLLNIDTGNNLLESAHVFVHADFTNRNCPNTVLQAPGATLQFESVLTRKVKKIELWAKRSDSESLEMHHLLR